MGKTEPRHRADHYGMEAIYRLFSRDPYDVKLGRINASGSLSAYIEDDRLKAKYLGETKTPLSVTLTDGENSYFFTRAKANEGRKLPLSLPDGMPTNEWLLIRGVDSDEFQRALDEHRQVLLANAAIEDEAARAEQNRLAGIRLHLALIMGWSFNAEFTAGAVEEFLREAPHIATEVNLFASNRQRFFRKSSTNSAKD